MTEQKNVMQVNLRIDGKAAAILSKWAEEAGSTSTTVARDLLMAAIQQAQEGVSKPLPPHLVRFYGMTEEQEEEGVDQ